MTFKEAVRRGLTGVVLGVALVASIATSGDERPVEVNVNGMPRAVSLGVLDTPVRETVRVCVPEKDASLAGIDVHITVGLDLDESVGDAEVPIALAESETDASASGSVSRTKPSTTVSRREPFAALEEDNGVYCTQWFEFTLGPSRDFVLPGSVTWVASARWSYDALRTSAEGEIRIESASAAPLERGDPRSTDTPLSSIDPADLNRAHEYRFRICVPDDVSEQETQLELIVTLRQANTAAFTIPVSLSRENGWGYREGEVDSTYPSLRLSTPIYIGNATARVDSTRCSDSWYAEIGPLVGGPVNTALVWNLVAGHPEAIIEFAE